MRHLTIGWATLLASLFMLPSSLMGTELRLNYGSTFSSSAHWNHFQFAEDRADLVDFDTGSPTGIDVEVAAWTGYTKGTYTWPHGAVDWIDPGEIGQGGAGRFGPGPSTVAFTNLDGLWRVEVLSSMDPRISEKFIQDITVNGTFADTDYRGLGVGSDDFDAQVDGQQAANWLIWSAVAPDSGTITIRFDSTEYGHANIMNAVRLLLVPEPSTLVLLCMGAVGLLVFTWRRKLS